MQRDTTILADHCRLQVHKMRRSSERWAGGRGGFGSTSGWITGLKTGESTRTLDHLLFVASESSDGVFRRKNRHGDTCGEHHPEHCQELCSQNSNIDQPPAQLETENYSISLWKRGQVILHNQCIELFGFHCCQFSTERKNIINLLMHRFWNKLFTLSNTITVEFICSIYLSIQNSCSYSPLCANQGANYHSGMQHWKRVNKCADIFLEYIFNHNISWFISLQYSAVHQIITAAISLAT